MFTESWYLMPVARFVEEFGLDHPRESLAAIEQITRRHTGEYAIRPYLAQWHEMTMAAVRDWARSDSHNVRRLASEGIRPRLPWAGQFAPSSPIRGRSSRSSTCSSTTRPSTSAPPWPTTSTTSPGTIPSSRWTRPSGGWRQVPSGPRGS